MKDKEKAQDIATQRAMLIAPLHFHDLDREEARMIRERICRETRLSERTIRLYISDYRAKGFTGLIPRNRSSESVRAIPPHVLEEAIRLHK